MKIMLNVEYKDKDKVKRLGATWDHVLKKWFVDTNKTQIVSFTEWLPKSYEHLNKAHVETEYELELRIERETNSSKKEIRRKKVVEAKQKQRMAAVMSNSIKPKIYKQNLYNGNTSPWDFGGEFIKCVA